MTSISPAPRKIMSATSSASSSRPLFIDHDVDLKKRPLSPDILVQPKIMKRPLSPDALALPKRKRLNTSRVSLDSSSNNSVATSMPPPPPTKKQPIMPEMSEKARGKLPEGRDAKLRSSDFTASLTSAKSTSKARNRRLIVQNEWNKITRRCSAAPVSFVNDIDNEDLPSLSPNFHYIENQYYDPHGLKPDYSDFFTVCECIECSDPNECGCKDKMIAYTEDVRLIFLPVDRNIEVIECNEKCSCDVNLCPNRVAQKPRDVPIEVFKTKDRGWGARSSVAVQKGKVLGIYTGTREDASNLSADRAAYCFDLDGFELPGEEAPEGACTVDSRVCGNWTRFINHSCLPNLDIYFVIYDTIPETHHPYIAFVAKKFIPARTEFTFDYIPHANILNPTKKGARPCLCESTSCRGYYTL
ncbi:hypothetical protein BDQ17DRAFT_1343558 [Cyathus striatus]|nr:hypothetical protein BDQ17DRAFT_1343558 [Cyathus striatus]